MKGSVEGTPVSSLVLWVEALDMEPLVMSMLLPEWVRGPDVAEVEDADMVLPRASVVVRSHCFASTVLGRMDGLAVALAP
jgi:hypothetical protein